ncbi:MAG TPA: glycosyltransferase family 4 protein [Solirubrobacteraceae bacterium]
MRILSVGNRYPPWSTGGYEITWAGAVQALRGAGHATRVLTTLPDPSDRAGTAEAAPSDVHRELRWYWRAHRFPSRGLADCVALERHNAAVLQSHLSAFRPDVVMWWAMGGMSLSLLEQARRAGIPALAVVGDEWVVYGPDVDGWSRRWRRGAARLLAPAVTRLTGLPTRLRFDDCALWSFNSAYTRQGARSAGWKLTGATVEHPGIDLERFGMPPAPQWRWKLLCCGRVDPRKGIATALQAMALLPAQATLTVHGDGDPDHLAELASLAERLQLADRVTFSSGSHDRVAEVYAACDALIFPVTWREPWGLVPLEAMACGRPVIATRAGGGAAEYLEDGGNCLQFEPGDARGLAASLRGLAADAELRAGLVRRGLTTAAQYPQSAFHEALQRRLTEAVARA